LIKVKFILANQIFEKTKIRFLNQLAGKKGTWLGKQIPQKPGHSKSNYKQQDINSEK